MRCKLFLHLVIAILVAQHSAFFSIQEIFLCWEWDFVVLCVLHTLCHHTVILSLISISEGKPVTEASSQNAASSCAGGRRGGRRALAVSWCWGWGWTRPTKTKNTTSCHTLHMLCLAFTNNLIFIMQCKLFLHLVITIFISQRSAFFSTRNLSLLRFRYFVCFTHTLCHLSVFLVWFLYLKVSRSLEPTRGTRPPARVGGEEGGRSLSAGVEAEGGEGEAAQVQVQGGAARWGPWGLLGRRPWN
jgi:hypothetical protein